MKNNENQSKWQNLIEPTPNLKVVANDQEVSNTRGYPYQMFDEVKIEIKNPSELGANVKEALEHRIEQQMLRRNTERVAIVVTTLDRLSPSKRKDRSRHTPKTTSKLIVASLNDIEPRVRSVFSKLDSLINRIPADGFKVRVKIGLVNTLEGLAGNQEEDDFKGF